MIRNQSVIQIIFVGLLFLTYVVINAIVWPSVVLAQGPAPFLKTPYFGTKDITSYYDHTSPLNQDQNVTYFDGRTGTVAGCDVDFNRAYATTNGQCLYYDGHEGVDFGTGYEAVLAAATGTVSQRGWNNPNNRFSGYGLFVDIQHTVIVGGQNVVYTTRYGHLSAIAVSLNQSVQAGQIIGSSGGTGNITGAHLHFSVLNQANLNTDPFGWTGGGTDPSGTGSICLWVDGEWANYCGGIRRPLPEPVNAGEILVDDTVNSSTGFGFAKGSGGIALNQCNGTCNLWSEAAVGFNSHMFHTAADKVNSAHDQWARWKPNGIQSDGAFYEIFVHVPSDNATSWQAPFVVWYHDNAFPNSNAVSQITTIDQEGLSNQWVSIGSYRMFPGDYVYTHDATGESAGVHCGAGQYCRLGVDAVKFVRRGTVYAPDVRTNNSGGMNSAVIVRNNGGGTATVYAKFMLSDGTTACALQPSTLLAHQTTAYICGSTQTAAAVIESNQDLSVLVRSFATGVAMLDNAFMGGNTVDPAFEQTATTLYVPAIYNNIFSGLNSTVHVQNTTSNLNAVTLTYTPRAGYGCNPCSTNFTLLGRGKLARAASTFVGGNASTGSLVITSDYPVAVKVEESQNGTISRSFNALAIGSTPTFVTAAYKAQFLLNTGLVIQNLHATSGTNVTLTYCERLGGCVSEQLPATLNARTAVGVNLSNVTIIAAPWSGSIQFTSSNGVPLGVAATNSRTNFAGGYDFNGTNKGSRVVVLPRAVKNTNGITTGYTVRNVSGQTVTVVAQYYNTNGTFAWSRTFTINVNGVEGFHQSNDTLGTSWVGSVVLSATDNIIAIMREDTSTTVAGYNGIPR